jgi:hypothetical protein
VAIWREIRNYIEGQLDQLNEDDAAFSAVASYSWLAGLARRTTCFYSNGMQLYGSEVLRYNRLTSAWYSLVTPEVM